MITAAYLPVMVFVAVMLVGPFKHERAAQVRRGTR